MTQPKRMVSLKVHIKGRSEPTIIKAEKIKISENELHYIVKAPALNAEWYFLKSDVLTLKKRPYEPGKAIKIKGAY